MSEVKEVSYVCNPCGLPFLSKGQLQEVRIHTYHNSKCDLCDKETGVTHIRAFNYLQKK